MKPDFPGIRSVGRWLLNLSAGGGKPVDEAPALLRFGADAGGKTKISGVAYSGGMVRLGYVSLPIVVDLAGMRFTDQTPLLVDHLNSVEGRIGQVRPSIIGATLTVDGEIVDKAEAAKEVLAQGKAGVDWQMSIGATVDECEQVLKGVKCVVNGKEYAGPFLHAKRSTLREVSVVAVGADPGTGLKVAAKLEFSYGALTGLQAEELIMSFSQWIVSMGLKEESFAPDQLAGLRAMFERNQTVMAAGPGGTPPPAPPPVPPAPVPPAPPPARPAAVTAAAPATGGLTTEAVRAEERGRVTAIQAMCAAHGADESLTAKAIESGWTADQTAGQILLARHQNRTPAAAVHSDRREPLHGPSELGVKTLEAALCIRDGVEEKTLVAGYGDRTMEAAYKLRNISLKELIARVCALQSGSMPYDVGNEEIRAAFSSVSLPGILSNVANKRLLEGYKAYPAIAPAICTEGNLSDFKESERYRLTDLGDLELVPEGGDIPHGSLTEEKAGNRLRTYGKQFALTREMIINDDLDAFMDIPRGMGARSARKIDDLFFTRLLSNPDSLFSDKNKNYREGADSALTVDGLGKAKLLFQKQVDAEGKPLALLPKFLLVPPELENEARAILGSTVLIAVGSTDRGKIPTFNPLSNAEQPDAAHRLTVVVAPYLSLPTYKNASAKAYYLFGNPAIQDTFEIGYFKGRKTPTVEKTEVDFDRLGIRYRVYFDVGVREQDHRGMVKSKGEA